MVRETRSSIELTIAVLVQLNRLRCRTTSIGVTKLRNGTPFVTTIIELHLFIVCEKFTVIFARTVGSNGGKTIC